VPARLVERGEVHPRVNRHPWREQAPLHVGGVRQLAIQAIAAAAQLALEVLPRQVAGHPGQHLFGLDRLGDVVGGADAQAGHLLRHVAERRQEDDDRLAGLRARLERTADLEAVHLRHHHVEQDQIGVRLGRDVEGRLAAARRQDAVTAGLQRPDQHLQVDGAIVHHQDGGGIRYDHRPSSASPARRRARARSSSNSN
jgi:hypothetical protein